MRQEIEISNFTAGELSPRLKGRTDLAKYFNGCETVLNMVPMPQGGATRRPGTMYVGNAKNQAFKNRLVRFVFGGVQAYILEFGPNNIRIYANDGVVIGGGAVPVDIASPYNAPDIFTLKFAQSADTLFIVHPFYPPATLTRSSNINWTLSTLSFVDGPYLDVNTTTTTLTPAGTTGSIPVVASSTTGINNGAGFTASDIGRHLRIKLYSLWAWTIITAVADTTHITVQVQAKVNNGATGAIDGTAWASATLYVTGTVVTNHGNFYRAVRGGQSGPVASNGPGGSGSSIIDGDVIWQRVGAYDATTFAQNTSYVPGNVVTNVLNSNVDFYLCVLGGKTTGTSVQPSGTGTNISTGDVTKWDYIQPIVFPTATTQWALGRWSIARGYPVAVRFWQQRLMFSGSVAEPNTAIGSSVADFTNMAPTAADGSVLATNGVVWVIDDDQVNAISAMAPAGSAQSMQLGLLTGSGEHILQAASAQGALTPSSIQAYNETSYGCHPIAEPQRIGKAVLFADRPGRKLREWSFYWQSNGYVGPDLLQMSEHITRAPIGSFPGQSGIAQMVYCATPYQVIWAILNDGTLISMTYDREQQVFAPARHRLGGQYYSGPPMVESIATIPSPDGSYDELWLTVLRTINGSPMRFIEVMSRWFDGEALDAAFFADAGLSSALVFPAGTLTPSGLVNSAVATDAPAWTGTGIFTASSNVFSGASVGAMLRLNGGRAVVTAFIDATHVTAQVLQRLTSLAPAPTGNWNATPVATSFSGLGHLTGEIACILGDGAVYPAQVVAAGAVAVPAPGASFATVGLPSIAGLVTMPWEPGKAAAASSSGKVKRVDTMWLRFHETLGGSFATRTLDSLTGLFTYDPEDVLSRSAADPMSNAPPLYSGSKKVHPRGGYDEEGQIVITQTDPLPLTVLSIRAGGEVEEFA